jgi:hypothetical protein
MKQNYKDHMLEPVNAMLITVNNMLNLYYYTFSKYF